MKRRLATAALLATVVVSDPAAAAGQGAPGTAPADTAPAPTPASEDEGLEKRVAGFATVALGMPKLDFVNELVGARFELGYTPRWTLGLSLAYANLKGKDGRVSNALPEASASYRVPFGDGAFGLPIRFAGGYLPMNGPTLRLTTGFDLTLGEGVGCELALLEPMIWVARDRPERDEGGGHQRERDRPALQRGRGAQGNNEGTSDV